MYEVFEHTADIGIRIRAGNLNDLFAEAARALFSVMVANLDAVRTVEETAFQIGGKDQEELLHDWLSELLYAFHGRRMVYADFRVKINEAGLTAIALGEPIDCRRHEIAEEVKAITWHGLKVERLGDQWTAEVIVDV